MTDPPPGSAEWPFVVTAVVSLTFVVGDVIGLSMTARERSRT
jgi:hypothetical protein